MTDLAQKVTNLITALFAVVFILLGAGILMHFFLPGAQLAEGTRLIFGGVILIYGIIRIVGVIKNLRKQSQPESTITLNGRGRNH
jgi:formate hydrogenlyase subunit 3/multisubunit Na+/H+ antiporter MnhD subunit